MKQTTDHTQLPAASQAGEHPTVPMLSSLGISLALAPAASTVLQSSEFALCPHLMYGTFNCSTHVAFGFLADEFPTFSHGETESNHLHCWVFLLELGRLTDSRSTNSNTRALVCIWELMFIWKYLIYKDFFLFSK